MMVSMSGQSRSDCATRLRLTLAVTEGSNIISLIWDNLLFTVCILFFLGMFSVMYEVTYNGSNKFYGKNIPSYERSWTNVVSDRCQRKFDQKVEKYALKKYKKTHPFLLYEIEKSVEVLVTFHFQFCEIYLRRAVLCSCSILCSLQCSP